MQYIKVYKVEFKVLYFDHFSQLLVWETRKETGS